MRNRNTIVMASILAGFFLACGPDDTSTTGSGGAGGSGGSGGAGGGGGSGTPMDPPGPKDQDAALQAAILIGSCVPDDGIQRVLNNMHATRGVEPGGLDFKEFTKCFEGKTNGCKAVEECLGIVVDLSGPCMPTCTGSVFKVCDDALAFNVDCAKFGYTCSASEGRCVGGPAPGPACDPGTFQESCQDGAPRVCVGKEISGPNCADYGLTCKPEPFGGVACLGTGAACQPDGTGSLSIDYHEGLACDGELLRACLNGGEQAVDCGTLVTGFTCQTSGAATFCGLAGACDPTAGADTTCEGDSVVVCNAGRIDKVDCKTLGFTSCNANFGTCGPSVHDQIMP